MEENKFDDLAGEEKMIPDEEPKSEPGDIEEMSSGTEFADITYETSGSGEAGAVPRVNRIAAEVYSWFDTLFFPLVIIMAIFTFFVRMSRVDGPSMEPTLLDGQQLFISGFMYEPSYNDIVVVWAEKLPSELNGDPGKAIVKRVIGLPGDKIRIDYDAGRIYRNGEILEIVEKDGVLYEDGHVINDYTKWEEGLGGTFTVPAGNLFVMGDNRNNSSDSRHPWIGYIDVRDVIGKVYLRVWPLNEIKWLCG